MQRLMKAGGLTGVLLLLVLLAACAPAATQYAPLPPELKAAPQEGKARICVIRGYVFWISSAALDQLAEDGASRGTLVNGSYICWERPPGEAHLTLNLKNWDSPSFQGNLVVKPGMIYYLYKDALSPGLKSITASEGQKYLAEYPKPEVFPGVASAYQPAGNSPPAKAGTGGTQPSAIQTVPRKEGVAY